MKKPTSYITIPLLLLLILTTSLSNCGQNEGAQIAEFDGQLAFAHVETQVAFGPRTIGSQAHTLTVEWIEKTLRDIGWQTEIQSVDNGYLIQNIVAKRGQGQPLILLGVHYDSRLVADHDLDPALRSQPVPGANDGASGVAVLLELARVLPVDLDKQVWLVFFDAEDNGRIPGMPTDWIMGSRAFAARLHTLPAEELPQAVVVLDMIGDANLNIHYEKSSTAEISEQIWEVAASLGYEQQFIPTPKYTIIDDHRPFLELGIPAVDIIDFDYPYWHTTQDTPDKVSAESLKAVGDTIYTWLTGD